MSFSRDINKQFKGKESDQIPDDRIKEVQSTVAQMIGLAAAGMEEAVIEDICNMIESGQRFSLEGYVLCLSRLVAHNKAWNLVNTAFQQKGEQVPGKYRKLFNVEPTTKTPGPAVGK